MEFNVDKQSLCFCRVVREAKAEQPVDCDITLPDYCPDVKSILNCCIVPGIVSGGVTGNRITAEGNALVRLVYVGDDDKIACFEQNYPLSKFVEMSALPQDAAVLVHAKTGYVNCRAVSPRRVDVHGCVTVLFSVACCESTDIVSGAGGDGLQLLQKPINTYSAVGCTSKLFQMSEVAPIPNEKSAAKNIIRATAVPIAGDIKIVANKLLIKGDLQVTVSWSCENGGVECMEHTMPISQIVELDGVTDGCLCDVKIETSSLDINLKPDADGALRQLDIAACLRATVYSYKEVSCAATLDAYSTKKELEMQRGAVSCESLAARLNETFVLTSNLDFTGAQVGEVVDAWCDGVTCVSGSDGDKLNISGTVTLCVLYTGDEGKPCFERRQCDYRFEKELDSNGGSLKCDPSVCVTAVSLSGKGASVPARVQLHIEGCVFASKGFTLITSLEQTDRDVDRGRNAAITVYFCDAGESVWDIAKRYGTSREAICRRNSINSETVEKESMLIIPGV